MLQGKLPNWADRLAIRGALFGPGAATLHLFFVTGFA